jgi:hypothetical protein
MVFETTETVLARIDKITVLPSTTGTDTGYQRGSAILQQATFIHTFRGNSSPPLIIAYKLSTAISGLCGCTRPFQRNEQFREMTVSNELEMPIYPSLTQGSFIEMGGLFQEWVCAAGSIDWD